MQPNGAGAAALLAAGIGVFATGLMTTLAEASPAWGNALNWWNPVGPLSGKTGVGVIVWLIAWAALHARYRHADVTLDRALTWTWILILMGFLGTFPTFFGLFVR
jgi:hypothetical protein